LVERKFEVNVIEKIEQGDKQISSCVFMPKNGRLFYGGDEGQVKELLFQENSNLFLGPRKGLKKVNHE